MGIGIWERNVPTNTNRPKRSKDSNSSEIWTSSCNHAKHGSDAYRGVERKAPPEDVAAEAPEYGAEEETNVLCEGEELYNISTL